MTVLSDAQQAWTRLSDQNAFESFLRTIPVDRLEDVIAGLEGYEDQFDSQHALPGVVVLLNRLPELPERPRGLFGLDARLVVGRVVYRLLRAIGDQDSVAQTVRSALPQINTLSAQFQLLTDIGYREGAGHRLVTEHAAAELEGEWRERVREAPPDELADEFDLLRVAYWTQQDAKADEARYEVPDNPAVTATILRSSRSDVRTQTVGSRAVRLQPRLAWETLTDVYGGEQVVRERIESLTASDIEVEEDLITLARQYLDGWRPADFGADAD